MSGPKIEDLRVSSSSIDDFFSGPKPVKRIANTQTGRVRIGSLHQLAGFQLVAEDTLVRLSQKDFWKLGKDDEGFFVERLVDDDSGPVKD